MNGAPDDGIGGGSGDIGGGSSNIGFSTTLPPYVALDLDSDQALPAAQACSIDDPTCESCQ